MPNPLSGPGLGLPFPQNLYPSQLTNAPQDASTNRIGLAPGDSFVIPAGTWYVSPGMYCVIQWLDPVTGQWTMSSGGAWGRGVKYVKSDGFNCRIANLTGCVVSASVVNGGSNYVQATTTITAIGSFSNGSAPTVVPIVGGALDFTGTFGTDIPTAGAGYGVAPTIMIPPPPPAQANPNGVGGIPAKAIAIIGSGGSLTSVSMIDQGAGYPTAPTPVVVTSPFDPNLSTGITQASVAVSLTSAGVIMGAFITNNGAPLNNGSLGSVTLSVGGAGSSGSLTANVMQTVVSGTITSIGAGYGSNTGVFTYGGAPVAGIARTPANEGIAFLPRQAVGAFTGSFTQAGAATIYDGGLFESAPTFYLAGAASAPTTVATVAMIMGSRADYIELQSAP